MEELLKKLAHEGGTIVSSSECSELEIAQAACCKRIYVTEGGLGYIWRPASKDIKDKLDTELEKLALKDGDIVLVRDVLSCMSAADCCQFAEGLKLNPTFQSKKDVQIIFIGGDADIESVSESDMNQAGWFRLPDNRIVLDVGDLSEKEVEILREKYHSIYRGRYCADEGGFSTG